MKKIILLILSGFGIRDNESGNAINMANIPNIRKIMSEYDVSYLEASGEEVGLPNGEAGNCEAGAITIGAGRVIEQPLTIINNKIKDKSFFENDTLLDLMDYVNDNNSTLHMIGLLSSGNVHSSLDHFYACLALAKIRKVKNVIFHFITDGKDCSQTEACKLIDSFMEKVDKLGLGVIGTICGRYYAMDNESNYDRVKKAYDAVVYNVGNTFTDYNRCLNLHYKNNITDEFINPSILIKGSNIKDGDGILFLNYRPEAMREFIEALTNPEFNMFNTKKFNNIKYACLYSVLDNLTGAYSNEPIINTFGKYLADLSFKQARISEAEKYPYVTYYFDGCEEVFSNDLFKILVPSIKVPRYDVKPEMSASDITTAVISAMEDDFDFILANFANPDALGHTGNLPACVRGLESIDVCVGKLLEKAQDNFYELVVTSDHGNVEYMKDSEGNIITSNTTNKVPFIICSKDYKLKSEGSLKDVIPTIIDMYEISKPAEMTGESLIIKENA